ncbi:UNVERIFIED_CONTAM: hypothetical protein BEN50_06010 [Euhalothece sp. KZN 001]
MFFVENCDRLELLRFLKIIFCPVYIVILVLESIDKVSPSLLYFLAQPSTSVQGQSSVILMLDRGDKVSVKDFNLIRRFFQGEVKKLPSGNFKHKSLFT